MAVPMADHALPGAARITVRSEQRGRINFETAGRIARDVAGRHQRFRPSQLPQQQPAHFSIRGGGGGIQQKLPIPA